METSSSRSYRIGIDARFWRASTGGLGRYSRELIKHLALIDKQNQYFVFITPDDLPEWNVKAENFHPIVTQATHYTWSEQTSFLFELLKAKLDLVHFLNFNHPILYWKPFVTTLQDLTVYYFPVGRSQKSKLRRFGFLAALRHSLTGAKRVISISENSAKDAEKVFGIKRDKVSVIYEGGPEVSAFVPLSKEKVIEYLKTDQPYFLFVSQWRPHKGIPTLIDAFNEFKKKTELPHKFVLVGNQGDMRNQVFAKIEDSPYRNDILTPGFVPDELLGSLYHYSAAYVLPSFYEGFGLMILEAFAFGAPVIVSNNSSLPEVGGTAARYFKTGDATELADALEEVATNPKIQEALREEGKKQLQRFSWEKCAQETFAVYDKVLEKL